MVIFVCYVCCGGRHQTTDNRNLDSVSSSQNGLHHLSLQIVHFGIQRPHMGSGKLPISIMQTSKVKMAFQMTRVFRRKVRYLSSFMMRVVPFFEQDSLSPWLRQDMEGPSVYVYQCHRYHDMTTCLPFKFYHVVQLVKAIGRKLLLSLTIIPQSQLQVPML